MLAQDNNTIKLELTQDKLLNFLMHAATREDIANLDRKIDSNYAATREDIANLDRKIDSNYEKLDEKDDSNYAKLDAKIDAVYGKLDAKIDRVYVKLDTKIDVLSTKMDAGFARVDEKFTRLIYFIIASIIMPIIMMPLTVHLMK